MKNPLYHVTLVAPEIPQNTGNIGRICCCTECRLHLVEPISFSLEDKYVRRAGMDYWHHVDFQRHPDWNDLLKTANGAPLYFFSTKDKKLYWDCPMEPGAFLVFGSEGHGLPQEYHDRYPENFYTIPMPGDFNRSLNLANSVAVAVYEVHVARTEVVAIHTILAQDVKTCLGCLLTCGEDASGLVTIEEVSGLSHL